MSTFIRRGFSLLALFVGMQVCAYCFAPGENGAPPGDIRCYVKVNGVKVLELTPIGYNSNPDKQWAGIEDRLFLKETEEFSSLNIPENATKVTLKADPDNSITFMVEFGGLLYLKELEIEKVDQFRWKALLPKGCDRQRWVKRFWIN